MAEAGEGLTIVRHIARERQRTRRAPSPRRGEGRGEGASDSRSTLAPSPDLLRFARKSTSPRRGEVEQVARVFGTALRRLPHQPPACSPDERSEIRERPRELRCLACVVFAHDAPRTPPLPACGRGNRIWLAAWRWQRARRLLQPLPACGARSICKP